MNKYEFLNKFQLNQHNTAPSATVLFNQQHTRKSAVLVPLLEIEQQLHVVLTQRAAHLKHHPGQISFPGGKVEKTDKNLIDTALREANEEIGLVQSCVNVIGQLPVYQTLTGFSITPIIGIVEANQQYTIDSNEVAAVFHVPLSHFINEANHVTLMIERQAAQHPVHFMPYNNYNIWGATAAILKDLCSCLK